MKLIQKFLCFVLGHAWEYNKQSTQQLVNRVERICIFCKKKLIEDTKAKIISLDKEYKNDCKK